jgi:hypothetical protein
VGAVAHPATSMAAHAHAAIADNEEARNGNEEARLGWVFLEIALALAIAVLIVWWTLPRKPRGRPGDDER